MRGKREQARERSLKARAEANAKAQAAREQEWAQATAEAASQQEVIPWLRALGYSAEQARRGAANCAYIPEAPLEERAKLACRSLARHCIRRAAPMSSSTR